MSTVWIVMIDILIAVFAVFSGSSIYQLIKFFRFCVPYTNEMISNGIISPSLKNQLLSSELLGILTFFILLNGLCVVGAIFTKPSGFIVYVIAFIIGVVVFRPSKDRLIKSEYTVNQYIRNHSVCMDMEKYNNYYC